MKTQLGTPRLTSLRCLLAIAFVIGELGCGNNDGDSVGGGLGGTSSATGGTTALGNSGTSNGRGGAPAAVGNSTSGNSTSSLGGNGNSSDVGPTVGGTNAQRGGTNSMGGARSGASTSGSDPIAVGGTNAGGRSSASAAASGAVATLGGRTATGGTHTGGANNTAGAKTTAALVGGGANTGGTKAAQGGASSAAGNAAAGGKTAAGGNTAASGTSGALPAVTIYIAGDSTVSSYSDTSATNDQAGWGQMLHEIFNTKVTVVNRAAGGRTAYWFYLEGAVTKILDSIKPGDYFFIQFGTNDQNTSATFTVDGVTYSRYAEAGTDFKEQLKQYYLDPTKGKGAVPVLVTPPPRNSAYCNGGNGLSAYATAMVELGAAENVAVLDNNTKTFNYLKAICPKPADAAAETFFKNNDGSIDGTHFQETGARKMAGFIGEEIQRIHLGLAAYLL